MKSDGNPIYSATAKSTGQRCQCPSRQGWTVCRLHGAGGGAPSGSAHPNNKHDLRTKQMQDIRRLASFLGKETRGMG